MLSIFLPKEEKYFLDFREMIEIVHEIGKLTNELFSSEKADTSITLKIRSLQERNDEILSKVVKRLNKSFITPFDREDIFALAKRLDSISDRLVGAASRIETFNISKKVNYADKLSQIVLQQLVELDAAIHDLKAKKITEFQTIKELEQEADKIYQNAIKELFARETNAIELIKEKEILELLESASDKCQSAANVVQSIYIKNS